MSSTIKSNIIKKLFRKRKYYCEHPDEAVADHLKQIETGSDDFIMEKVEKWEKEQKEIQRGN